MNISQICALFTMFSGETDINRYRPLIDSAVIQVTRRLKNNSDEHDPRLDYLCASIANYKYSEMSCVRNKVAYTYAGTTAPKNSSKLEYDLAKALMDEYFKAASDLLSDEGFAFASVAAGQEVPFD